MGISPLSLSLSLKAANFGMSYEEMLAAAAAAPPASHDYSKIYAGGSASSLNKPSSLTVSSSGAIDSSALAGAASSSYKHLDSGKSYNYSVPAAVGGSQAPYYNVMQVSRRVCDCERGLMVMMSYHLRYSACHYWTSVFCMLLLDQCVLHVLIGPVCSACHYWTSVFCMSLLDQCVLHVIIGPVCSACPYWTSVFCMSLLDHCVLHVIIGPMCQHDSVRLLQ